MSGGIACRCGERQKPARERAWVVFYRKCNYSAFSGYHRTASDYSAVRCLACGANWRSKADYVNELPDEAV